MTATVAFNDLLTEATLDLGPHPGKDEPKKFCPAHPNSDTPALSVTYGDPTLLNCKAGCTQESVLEALLGPKDDRPGHTNGYA